MSRCQHRAMIDRGHPRLSLLRQCALLGINRTSVYYRPAQPSAEDLELMARMDRRYPSAGSGQALKTPFYGSRRMTV